MLVIKDVDGLNRNPSFSELDTIGTHWHGETYLDILPSWHVVSFLAKWLPKGIMSKFKSILHTFLGI